MIAVVEFLLWAVVSLSLFDLLCVCMASYQAARIRDEDAFYRVNVRAALYGMTLTLALGFIGLLAK